MFLPYCVVFACMLVLVQGPIVEFKDKAGNHCGNFTGDGNGTNSTDETEHHYCVECLYPQNCLAGNQCLAGSRGDTCEKCEQGYHRVGSTCVKCPSFPWSAVSFGVYFLLLMGAIFYHGLTDSVCTKVKLLSHFLQNVLLSLHIKIAWSEQLMEIFSFVNFGKFNSDILYPGFLFIECLFTSWPSLSAHYLEWISSLCIAVLTIVLGKFLDVSMKQLISIKDQSQSDASAVNHQRAWQKRTTVRRLVVVVTLIIYMPATLSCIRTFQCSDTIPKLLVLDHTTNVFLLDNDVSCDTFVFQTIHFFATVYLVFLGLLLPPMLIFFTLRQRKWELLNSQWLLYGPVYETYKEKYCFWEAIPLLRKLIAIVITEAYPVSAFLQTAVQLGMSGIYLLAVMVLRPYRKSEHEYCEKVINGKFNISNLVICLLQVVALSVIFDMYQPSSDIVVAGCVCVIIIIWIVLMVAMICESKSQVDIELQIVNLPSSTSSSQCQPERRGKRRFQIFKKTKIEPDPKFVEKVKENKAKIDF